MVALAVLAVSAGVARAQLARKYELPDLKAMEEAFVRLAAQVRPSVVALNTYRVRDPAAARAAQIPIKISQGSGLIMDAEGYIATNRHVLEDANYFVALLHDGRRFDATVRQTDLRSDLAVLKIDAEGLVPVRWGDLASVKVGQWAMACGNPFGLALDNGSPSVTVGTVSALGREMTRRLQVDPLVQYYGNLIETSSPVNPGSSGGPLFNVDGEVIGIVTAIETRSGVNEGVGFAIPVDRNTRHILETLKTGEKVRYGYLGVTVENVDPPASRRVADTGSARGVRITVVDPADGPAAKAELRPGDVILDIGGTPIDDADQLIRVISFLPVGSQVDITYTRRQVKRRTTAVLGDRHEMLRIESPDR
ncbi:MAG: trypsin-like peptidase domain-containing protein [Planctomycetes bacterium]|nr:trypsin-like peptidase domain-containing protein [Planctomycetota bacterium]